MVVAIWYRKYLSCHTHKKQATGSMNTNIFRFGSSIGVKGGVKVFARRVDGTFGATRCCPTWTSYPYCMGCACLMYSSPSSKLLLLEHHRTPQSASFSFHCIEPPSFLPSVRRYTYSHVPFMEIPLCKRGSVQVEDL